MSRQLILRAAAAALLLVCVSRPLSAETVTIKDESPAVTVNIPEGFETTTTDHGVQAKTPDGEVYVWFETYNPDERDALVKEHDEYWTANGVEIGSDTNRSERSVGEKKVVATAYTGAMWKGKPTVIRYLFIDPALPSKKLILMSLWASPDGDKARDADVISMIESLKIKE